MLLRNSVTCCKPAAGAVRPILASYTSRPRPYQCHSPAGQRIALTPDSKAVANYGSRHVTAALPHDSSSSTTTSSGSNGGSSGSDCQPKWIWEESRDAVRAYGIFFGWLALGSVPAVQMWQLTDLPYFIGLAVLTVYIGSHRGLTSRSKQQVSFKEGLLAPLLASASLFGLYLIIKYLPGISLQTFLDAYFWLIGTVACYGAAKPVLRQVLGSAGRPTFTLQPPEGFLRDEQGNAVGSMQYAPSDIAALVISVGLISVEVLGHHTNFTLNNMVACLVATEILSLVGLRSFKTATLLLGGLLAYDVFWVFGSPKVVGDNVMLTVATSDLVTGPTRLLFPKMPGGTGEAADFPFSLLGLGDIALPGLLAGLALRYDASRMTNMQARAVAAAAAIQDALAALNTDATGKQVADAAADAAVAAYDDIADRELQQRNNTQPANSNFSSQQQQQHSSVTTAVAEPSSSSGTCSNPGQQQQQQMVPVSPEVLQQRTYFTRVLCAHVGGLLTAFAANSATHLGQPALLYIVPATLLTVFATAGSRGEIGRVWDFTDFESFGVPPKEQ